MLNWSYSGVNFAFDGAGGPACVGYLTDRQKAAETGPCLALALLQLWLAVGAIRRASRDHGGGGSRVAEAAAARRRWSPLRLVGAAHVFVFGIEIGFKLSTGTLIWLLNPCHVITVIQISLLLMPVSPFSLGLFRVMIHLLNGPLLALLLPVVNTRLLPGEVAIYYVQHLLILALPFFLMLHDSDAFFTEQLLDFSWVTLSQAVQSIYHFTVLQPVSTATMVNLDSILCPAISDPFRGRYYRLWAVFHQFLQVIVQGKCLTCVYHLLLFALRKSGSPGISERRNGGASKATDKVKPA